MFGPLTHQILYYNEGTNTNVEALYTRTKRTKRTREKKEDESKAKNKKSLHK